MRKALNPEIALGFLIATTLWIVVLGWQASYAPTDSEKRQCEETARKSGHKTEECKTIWEKTTTDPVAFFTFVLSISTIGLWIVAWRSGVRQSRDMDAAVRETRRIGEAQVRAYVSIKGARIDFDTEYAHPQVTFIATNSGQSPARNFIWSISIQYAGDAVSRAITFNEKWLDSTGIDIPAGADTTPPERAQIAYMSVKRYIEDVAPNVTFYLVRVKIDFRYTDVFDIDWFEEAYFAAVMTKNTDRSQSVPGKEPVYWRGGELIAMAKPNDWGSIPQGQKD
jgi:hypothetical protein